MSCPEFVSRSLAVRTAAHIAHLMSKSYSAHIALADFYEALVDKVDRYAELHMAEKAGVTFPSVPTPTGTPVGLLNDYLVLVRKEFAEEGLTKSKENVLVEIEELTLSTLYKLKNLS